MDNGHRHKLLDIQTRADSIAKIIDIASFLGVFLYKIESGKMRYVGAIFYETNSENKLAFLKHLVGVNEYEVDGLGNYEHKLWEWK